MLKFYNNLTRNYSICRYKNVETAMEGSVHMDSCTQCVSKFPQMCHKWKIKNIKSVYHSAVSVLKET